MKKLILAFLLMLTACDQFVGPMGPMGPAGPAGPMGPPGADGQDGKDGTSCVAALNPDDSISFICGETELIVEMPTGGEYIDPCPSQEVDFPELLLLYNDQYYAVYANVSTGKIHWSRLPPRTYVTTDGRSCQFRINSDGSIQEL